MDHKNTIKQSVEGMYFGDFMLQDVFNEEKITDTIYMVIAIPEPENPDRHTGQKRQNESGRKEVENKILPRWRENSVEELLGYVKFDLREDDPSADLPYKPTDIEVLDVYPPGKE